ncbi:MAG: prepilin-type N-terminal cleavage/methylation domain-containing protein [Phycisphaerales bacterium]|jgi:prepilin-type N-terminal cleavage/methylation domain-containing protein
MRTTRNFEREHRGLHRRAFTLVELILVIIIILILAAIAIPAYASLTYSSNQSGAANAVQAALQSARDAAVRAGSGRDAAAVFLLGDDGRVRIVVAQAEASILDDAGGGSEVLRDILVPSPGVEVVVLPRNWSVRGYARSTALSTAGGSLPDNLGWYEDTYTGGDRDVGQWVFPETIFYDQAQGNNGDKRQSFMVRFEGGTGRFLSSASGKALYIDPAPTLAFRDPGTPPWSANRVDREENLGRFVRKVLADPSISIGDKRLLLGDVSSDTVLVGPVGQIAVYNEKRLANAIGADGLSRNTDTLYSPIGGSVSGPEYDSAIFGSVTDPEINLRIGLWMRASGLEAGALPASETSDARIFLVSRYLGQPIEAARLAEGD